MSGLSTMRLAVVSHKICWPLEDGGYGTDGGFPLQMRALSELFDSTELVVPCELSVASDGISPIIGKNVSVNPLLVPKGKGLRRKLDMVRWVLVNGPAVWRAVRDADAVHVPIPGDVGTWGMIFALLMRKPLFVRHCGNWLEPRTLAEGFWRRSMEFFAGSKNLMLATGGSHDPPSQRNPNIGWIFSTSMTSQQLACSMIRTAPDGDALRLIIVCRQEERKGTDVVIEALPTIARSFPGVHLDVVGGGSLLKCFERRASDLGLRERTTFHGKVSQDRVISLLEKADIFCYPTSASEGFPKVVLEAIATGMPVVTTPISVLPQLLSNGCGRLIREHAPVALAEAVIQLAGDKEAYEEMSRKAIETASEYSLERWRDQIGAMLEEAWQLKSTDFHTDGFTSRI